MLGQCQHANNNVLPTTLSITQRWPNDCLLSGVVLQTLLRQITVEGNVLIVCLFCVYRPTRESFNHKETSPLPVKGYKFGPMLGTHGR